MNYTENYHLPQWVKSDRIMMEDFNQMCESIDAGLAGSVQTSDAALQKSDALEQKTLDRLRRLAYNHYCAVQNLNPFPWQMGIFHQEPAKDGTGVTGTALWNGVCFSAKNPAGVTLVGLDNYMEEIAPMTLVKNSLANCTTLKVNFCVPVTAYLSTIDLCGNVRDNVPNTPFPARLTLVNLDTGETEISHLLNLAQSEANCALINNYHDCYLAFHAGQHYQLRLQPLAAVFGGDLHLTSNDRSYPIRAVTANDRAITASHTMQEPVGSSGGLLIVRGLVHGGALTVKWDGQAVPLQTTRMVQIPDGRMVREMVYFRAEPVPAETTFSLRYDNNAVGSFLFYDWGAVLL